MQHHIKGLNPLNIVLIGSGGRESAIAWALRASDKVEKLTCIPGNAGMAQMAACVPGIKATNIDAICVWVENNRALADFVVVAPDDPLALGLVDRLEAMGVPAFGPTAAAARVEASKSFSKDIMTQAGIPTARWQAFDDVDAAVAYIQQQGAPIVIKADGLALGKGVCVAKTVEEAVAFTRSLMVDGVFAASGSRIVIEECMQGPEATLLCFCDGKTAVPMVSSQDHKRALTGDLGPNTGGMGAFAPTPFLTPEHIDFTMQRIVAPLMQRLSALGCPFKGVLYVGLMVTGEGPKVIEFNARFGDPETQAVLPLLKTDLLEIMLACREGRLASLPIAWSSAASCCVVMASGGYPERYETGKPITGIDAAQKDGALVFHAGTAVKDGVLVTSGGRVLGVTCVADSVPEAAGKAYGAVGRIAFEGEYHRADIGAAVKP